MNILRWGAGVNSTALAVGLREQGIRPDYVIFSDTGDEKPETYAYISVFQEWLRSAGFPELLILRYQTKAGDTTLEEYCNRVKDLPSRAYGLGSCADKWKIRPMEKWSNHAPDIRALRAVGGKPTILLGYDAGEQRRFKTTENERWKYRAPLIEWGWDREECLTNITLAGLPTPPKSACFYCPSSTKTEILALAADHPDLMARALAMEDAARAAGHLETVQGLGRRFAWRTFLESENKSEFAEVPVEACATCSDDSCDREEK